MMELLSILRQCKMCMAPTQPTFDGTGSPQEFLQLFEEYFEARGGDKVTVFGRCMRGEEAANWYEYCATYEGDDWGTISRSFLERFGIKLRKDELLEALYTFTIGKDESLYSFMERFAKYLRLCEANDVQSSVTHQVYFFIKGFKTRMPTLYQKLHKCFSRGELTSMKIAFGKAKSIIKVHDHLPEFDGALHLNVGTPLILKNAGLKQANVVQEPSMQTTFNQSLLGHLEVRHNTPSFNASLSHAPSEEITMSDNGSDKSQIVLDCLTDYETHYQHVELQFDQAKPREKGKKNSFVDGEPEEAKKMEIHEQKGHNRNGNRWFNGNINKSRGHLTVHKGSDLLMRENNGVKTSAKSVDPMKGSNLASPKTVISQPSFWNAKFCFRGRGDETTTSTGPSLASACSGNVLTEVASSSSSENQKLRNNIWGKGPNTTGLKDHNCIIKRHPHTTGLFEPVVSQPVLDSLQQSDIGSMKCYSADEIGLLDLETIQLEVPLQSSQISSISSSVLAKCILPEHLGNVDVQKQELEEDIVFEPFNGNIACECLFDSLASLSDTSRLTA